jgi:hypothetical protein
MPPVTPIRAGRRSRRQRGHRSWGRPGSKTRTWGLRPLGTIRALGDGISRDPIGDLGGHNLYGFVNNNSVGRADLLGLQMRYPGGKIDHSYPGDLGYPLLPLPLSRNDERRFMFLKCLTSKLFIAVRQFMSTPEDWDWMHSNFATQDSVRGTLFRLAGGSELSEQAYSYCNNNDYWASGSWEVASLGEIGVGLNLLIQRPIIDGDELFGDPVSAIGTVLHEPMHYVWGPGHIGDWDDTLAHFVGEASGLLMRSNPKSRCCGTVQNQNQWEEVICQCNKAVYGKEAHDALR